MDKMVLKRVAPAFAAALALAFAAGGLSACGPGGGQKAKSSGVQTVRVDGSSTVFPLSEAAAEQFMAENSGRVRVTVGESGTGGGFAKFCRGETEVQDASRPILETEMATCRAADIPYVEIPIAFDGLTVVVHPSNPLNSVTIAQLKRVWEPQAEGQIMNWRQANPAWPNMPLQLFGAGTASGTFDFFTEAVVGTAKSSRTDFTPTEDDNVTVQGVATNPGAMGFFGIAYYEQNKQRLKALAIDAGAGPIAPNADTVAAGTYPLARPMFLYANANALRRPAVQQFVQFYVANAARIAPQVGYIPLPASAYETYAARVRDRTAGTAFGGHQDVGANIAEVLARPLAEAGAPPAP
ncbi:MAG: PstS family phosphate ABC transporter substrate-binding protein [Hyphomonadaceae bacterium]|nr:PstS family phosphate ABC transporter substrate-binding protein [Hyphomonadaceae bacterium]